MNNTSNISEKMVEAEHKAWDALSRYKFLMFGYWCAVWVHLNKLSPLKVDNPFRDAVKLAKSKCK